MGVKVKGQRTRTWLFILELFVSGTLELKWYKQQNLIQITDTADSCSLQGLPLSGTVG